MALGGADAYYRSMAEELANLSRRGAEISWASDAAPRPTSKTQRRGRELAPTGRLPKAAKMPQAKPGPPAISRKEAVPSVPRSAPAPWPAPAAGAVEVSTRKPSYLMEVKTRPAEVKTRPAVLARRGAQPRSQLRSEAEGIQRPRARRLQLSRAREVEAAQEPPMIEFPGEVDPVEEVPRSPSAASTSHLSRTPTQARSDLRRDWRRDVLRLSSSSAASLGLASGGRVLPDEIADAGAMGAADDSASASSAAGASLVVGDRELPAAGFAVVEDPAAMEKLTPRPGTAAAAPPPAPVQVKARLASVTDLQLILPERVAVPPEMRATVPQAIAREAVQQQPGVEQDANAEKPNSATAGPPPMVRPVLRSLIADVIEEMRVPEYEPAEVYGGKEVKPFLSTRSELPARARAAPLHEDLCGYDMGRPPPAYTQGPPPAYETQKAQPKTAASAGDRAQSQAAAAAAQMRQQASSLTKVQEALQAQTDALVQAQAQAQAQLQVITTAQATMQAQREESLQLTRAVQQHADDARRRLEDAATRQAESLHRGAAELQQQLADVVRLELQRDAAAAQQQLTSAVQQSVQVAQSALATASRGAEAGAPPLAPPPAPAPQVTVQPQPSVEAQLFPAMVEGLRDGLRRIEVRLEQQATQLVQAQSEERAAQLAALRSMQATPRAVHALVPPPPPPPAPAPEPVVKIETADVEAQVSLPPPKEHEERVARFTEYLLHGPPGERVPPKVGLAPPLLAWPLPADLAEIDAMLADALGVAPAPADTTSESLTGVLTGSGLEEYSIGEVSYTTWRDQMISPGELSPALPSLGELTSGALSPDFLEGGEMEPYAPHPGEPSAAFSAGEVSAGEVSYGEVLVSEGFVSDVVSPVSMQDLEPGELTVGGAADEPRALGTGSPGSLAGAISPEPGALSEGEAEMGADAEDGSAESS